MIQIGLQPPSAAFTEGRRSNPDDAMGDHSGLEGQRASDLSEAESGDCILFVSPPPLPFPRVFPGL